MTWALFYLVCFFVGLAMSALSFFSGIFHFHVPTRLHLPHAVNTTLHHAGALSKAGSTTHDIPFFNMSSLMAFLCWFGGMGYLLTVYGKLWAGLAFMLSVLFGLGGAAIVFWFLVKVMLKHDIALSSEDFEMVGVIGSLNGGIRSGGTGEMIFLQEGTRRVTGARSENGAAIAKGVEVVVTRYEKGIAYVRPWNEFAEEHRIVAEGPSAVH